MSKPQPAMQLHVEPLTAAAFAPFGQVIQTEGAKHFPMNAGAQERYYDLAAIEIAGEAGRPVISIAETCQVASLPYRIPMVERHPLGSQAFIPLDDHPQLIVVAPAGEFALSGLRAFYSEGRQGINYACGVWHMPMISMTAGQRWLIVDRAGSGNNCDEVSLVDTPVMVTR
jgi:ureidoglycolate lyase